MKILLKVLARTWGIQIRLWGTKVRERAAPTPPLQRRRPHVLPHRLAVSQAATLSNKRLKTHASPSSTARKTTIAPLMTSGK
jgi:hypothetical protein